jgi:hypothetical protein
MPKFVTFYSEGVKLAGDLMLPADIKPGERRAGIVLCHGYRAFAASICRRTLASSPRPVTLC